MKTVFLSIILSFCTVLGFAQTIRRVNNTSGLNDPTVYATAQAAHDAAADGDIIQLEPSDNPNYGDITITKKLTIYGTGYDLANTPNTSFDKRAPKLGYVYFENGSKNSSIMGVEISGYVYVYDENVTVSRCKMYILNCGRSSQILNGVYSEGNNMTITQNYFYSMNGSINANGSIKSTILNNIITGGFGNFSQSVISNNVFSTGGGEIVSGVKNSVFTNNIIDARSASAGTKIFSDDVLTANNTISNNLCTSISGLPTGGGNVNSANALLVFKVANPWTGPFYDSNLQLATNSPAQKVGVGSTPIGIFAGNNPYVLSGVPNIPVITTLMTTGAGSTATPLNVTISVRSSN